MLKGNAYVFLMDLFYGRRDSGKLDRRKME